MKNETRYESTPFPGTKLKKRPNIMLLITDQQRQEQHWPPGWLDKHMPTIKRLKDNGVTFTNNYTAATACSPSRASFLTGVYPSVHKVKDTPPKPKLPSDIMNIFKLAEQAGYNVAYKGKMHLFTPQGTPSEQNFSRYDIGWAARNYKFNDWNPPDCALDAGGDVWICGGHPNNDTRYVHGMPNTSNRMTPAVDGGETIMQGLDRLGKHYYENDKPFLLVCSFGNPHDISLWPVQDEWGYNRKDYANLHEINLPKNYDDDLKEKPSAQKKFRDLTDETDPHCTTHDERERYCRFYAYLHTVVDKQIEAVLDKLDDLFIG